ncbi:hypothetical protein VTK73DRAFT_8986 [Phialemonium thermophilum]|uniref:RNA polymerase I-specific transcription initiation factor RRN6-like protein n=1 Tax=Phialemonium thermophilum TaxID=223376 RepID=A0ABR3XLP4_9PEZI
MADSMHHGQPKGHSWLNVAGGHQLNDLNYGHVGRLTYIPADSDGEGLGKIHTTRSVDDARHFGQILPFEPLFPATRSVLPDLKIRPWKAIRAANSWLLKTHPEALSGTSDVQVHVSDELQRSKKTESDSLPPSLLAVGEITTLAASAARPVGQPAIAFASGEGGHILRLITLTAEIRKDLDGSMLRFSSTRFSDTGQWTGDGLPISLVKFATDQRRNGQIRWLLVQKATSTTVFEPEIRKSPVIEDHLRGTYQISANPLFTIGMDMVGPGRQSDVSFNAVSSGGSPQLAVIDSFGNWSVLDVMGNRLNRPKQIRPVLRARGSMQSVIIPPLSGPTSDGHLPYRIQWVSSSRTGGSPEETGSVDFAAQLAGNSEEEAHSRLHPSSGSCRYILISNNVTVQVLDIRQRVPETGLNIGRPNKGERILDIQICPFDLSRVFVLTSKSLFWLEVVSSTTGSTRLNVIVSAPHYKNSSDASLRLCTSPGMALGNTTTCSVFIYSTSDSQMVAFWFTKPTIGSPGQMNFWSLSLEAPCAFHSLAVSNPELLHGQSNRVTRCYKGASMLHSSHVYQAFALGPDMSISSSLIGWSHFPVGIARSSVSGIETEGVSNRRKKLLRHGAQTFVVPDDILDGASGKVETGQYASHIIHDLATARSSNIKLDFNSLSAHLRRLIEGSGSTREPEPPALSSAILSAISKTGDDESLPLQLLSDLCGPGFAKAEPRQLHQQWVSFQSHLRESGDSRITLVARQAYGFTPDPNSLHRDLVKQMLIPDALPENFCERQEHALSKTVGQAYMSLLGISVAPRPMSLQAENPSRAEDLESGASLASPTDGIPLSPASADGIQVLPGQPRDVLQEPDDSEPHTDRAIARLRRYMHVGDDPRYNASAQSRLLSRWPEHPGSDARTYVWKSEESREVEEVNHQRKRREDTRRRRSERRTLSGLRPDEVGEPSTQPLPHTDGLLSSQPQEAHSLPTSSVTQLPFPSQPMSQVTPGVFGARAQQPISRRPKAKREARKSGFR